LCVDHFLNGFSEKLSKTFKLPQQQPQNLQQNDERKQMQNPIPNAKHLKLLEHDEKNH
jgi:hypothetical protein